MSAFQVVQSITDLEAWAVKRILNPNGTAAWRFKLVERAGQWVLTSTIRVPRRVLAPVVLAPPLAHRVRTYLTMSAATGPRQTLSAAELLDMILGGSDRLEQMRAEAEEAAFRSTIFDMTVRRLWGAGRAPSAWETQEPVEVGGQTLRSATIASDVGLLKMFALLRPQLGAVEPWGPRVREIASDAVAALAGARHGGKRKPSPADTCGILAILVTEFACEAVSRTLRYAREHDLQDLPGVDDLWPDDTLASLWWALDRAYHDGDGVSIALERLARFECLAEQLRDFAMAEILTAPRS